MIIGIEVQRLFRRRKHAKEIVALEIINQLQQTDHENQYVIFAKNDVDEKCIKHAANFRVSSTSSASYPIWEQMHLPGIVGKIRPDVLHCSANTAPLFGDTPLIITIHDVDYLESMNFSGSSYQNFKNLYRRFIVPKVARKAAVVLTVSEYEKKIIAKKLNMQEDKIRVVYNGVNEMFQPIQDTDMLEGFRVKYDLPIQFLLHFVNTAPQKNTIGVLAAYKIYCDKDKHALPLVLTDCTSVFVAGLLKQIGAPELIDQITILDYVPFSSIPCLYNLATVFLYPSHRESFGMPLIEAMASGVPVITSNTSALPEIAGEAACLIDPASPEEIAESISLLLHDKDFYSDRQQKGFENAKRFSWKKAAAKTLEIYKEVAMAATQDLFYNVHLPIQ